ncbi:unnamed protein product [Parnassius mnemosyne]|uniref:Gustatory receptor n=1 Tax=Parnassius mnemosyne TaxID=213953 RepID=A0AAV1KA49_9NEOP
MKSNKVAQKTTPLAGSAKYNNFLVTFNVAHRLKYLIDTEILFGVNRIYLLDCSKAKFWTTQLYIPFLLAVIIYLLIFTSSYSATYNVVRNTSYVECVLLSISATYLQRKKLSDYFKNMSTFDENFHLINQLISPNPKKSFICVGVIIISVIVEFLALASFGTEDLIFSVYVIYFCNLIHEIEMLFFCTLLHSILLRIRILKTYVANLFNVKEYTTESSRKSYTTQESSKTVNFDINFLHKNYELLHKMSEELNSSMSFSMIVMFSSSGISTIMLLKHLFQMFQINEITPQLNINVAYVTIRCLRLTILMIIPCYLSNHIYSQVAVIRKILYDALDFKKQDKLERRKIKVFYQLTHDHDLAYVLWGLIKLDMSLPLNYSSLCTTYLVIVLQFSKFID